jgi:hypothetical protein
MIKLIIGYTSIKLFVYITMKGQNIEKYLKYQLFFNEIYKFSYESYFDLLIASYINIRLPNYS